MNRSVMIYGFEERVREVCNEWQASGRRMEDLADLMGIGRSHLYTSGHMWQGYKIAKFCAVTGVSADWLLGLKEERS